MKILHLTPHLGGGVGSVLLNYFDYVKKNSTDVHSVALLDDINLNAREWLNGIGFEFYERQYHEKYNLISLINKCDILVVHWWNHPILSCVLMRWALPESRMVIWSHISGEPAPNCFNRSIFEYCDRFVFTTPMSYLTSVYASLPDHCQEKVSTIWSTGGVERTVRFYRNQVKNSKKIGYVGNLDYTKLHPDFIKVSEVLISQGYEITVIGPLTERFAKDISKSEFINGFDVTGFVSEDEKFKRMSEFAVFGYPLARHHYATCDQSIQEAMALEAVPVVLNNGMETYMVEHGETGWVARDLDEYVDYVMLTAENEVLRAEMASKARRYAFSEYSIIKLYEQWNSLYEDVAKQKKTAKVWHGRYATDLWADGVSVFIESLGDYAEPFVWLMQNDQEKLRLVNTSFRLLSQQPQWTSKSKSSPMHFLSFFPTDKGLQSIKNKLEQFSSNEN